MSNYYYSVVNSKRFGGRVYVYYHRGLHQTITLTDVCVPGDLMSIFDRLTADDKAYAKTLVERQLRRHGRSA